MAGDLLGSLLRQVSRSFYLSLAVLPRSLREPIGLAYLLARAADTVADTRLIPRDDRLGHLEILRRAGAGELVDVRTLARACAPLQSHAAERRLLERVGEAIARVEALAPADRHEVRAVLATLTSGMIFDLTRFPGEDTKGLAAIETLEELDHYVYLVAGCVGPFWTALHIAHRPRLSDWPLREMSEQGVSFGKALQLTNVLRDVPGDLAHGRCYLPARELAALGLGPRDLLEPAGAVRARPLYRRLAGPGPRALRRRVGLHAGDSAARVAHAAGVRVAAPDRARDPRGSHRAPEPPRRDGADQDSPARGARAAGAIGVHGLVQSGPRRPRRSGAGDHRRLISSCENGLLDRRVNKRERIVLTMEEDDGTHVR